MIVERTISIWKKTIDDALDAAIPSSDTYPEKLHQAMRHGVFPGGKRIRPLLVLCTGYW
jgi:farnesyl diphosphate synthase